MGRAESVHQSAIKRKCLENVEQLLENTGDAPFFCLNALI